MSTFVLIPGAGGAGWYWSHVVPVLTAAGHEVIALDLPGPDPEAGLQAYADVVVRAIGTRDDVILVAQSLGGFTAPLVCERVPVRVLVLVNAMIPTPGETASDWGGHTKSNEARTAAAKQHGYTSEFEVQAYFFHDVPDRIFREGAHHEREEAPKSFGDRCEFSAWPKVPTHVIAGTEDRLFPLPFQQRVARERLGLEVEPITGGHLVALSNPTALAQQLLAYV